MENSRWKKLLLFQLSLCISLLMIQFPLSHAYQPCISTCLANHNIANFTLFPQNNVDPSLYYNLLDYSIRNARFAEPSVPKPAAIVLPNSKEQLVKSVLCSRKCSLEIRVRCGGHSYEGTSSVATDGFPFVIIDLINLDDVSVDLESKTAWVEGGATLGQTYYAISKTSEMLGFPAGSCPTVGIGGHISGGGFGLLSRKYGLAADNVVDALLVDAKGQVLDRKAMGEDVFWAIRGGGGGVWGIVYAWKIRLVEVPKVLTCFIVSRHVTRHNAAKLVHKWQLVAPMLDGNFYLSCVLGTALPKGKTVARISPKFIGYYLGPKEEAMSILNRVFVELGLKEDECNEMNWIESVMYYSGLSSVLQLKNRGNHKIFFKAKSDYVKNTIPKIGIRSAIRILEKQPKGYVILDPYGGIMENISSESIAFPHRKGNLFCIQYMVTWQQEDNEKSKEYMDWIRDFYNTMTPYVSKSPREAYINYMDLDLGQTNGSDFSRNAVDEARAWGEKYFLSNYDRLVQAKTYVDPHNIFRHQQGIPPLPIAKVMSNVTE